MDTEAKKLFNQKAWAIDAPSNRAELNDPTITPQIDRADGWDTTYSQSGGNLPDRRHFNQILCEMMSAALHIKDGVPAWDGDINYPADAITKTNSQLWIAKVNTGPATSNAVNPTTANQNVWEPISGSRGIPDAPESFQGTTPAQSTIIAQWKAGDDNGAKITQWGFQYAIATTDWADVTQPVATYQYPYVRLEGLEAGTGYKVRARAINSEGTGPWGYSVIGATGFTTTGTVPGGGNSLALLATAGNGEVDLKWEEPDNGGYPILRYTIQWKTTGSGWDENLQTSTTGTEKTIENLTNGQEYTFRVKASNLIGDGDWSNERKATPVAPPVTTYNPTLNAPTLQVQSTTTINAQPNEVPSVVGKTAAVTGYIWEFRQQGVATWTEQPSTTSKSYTFENLQHGTTYEIRYKVTTSLGTTSPSPSRSATTQTATAPVVTKVQPRLRSPSATRHSSGGGVSLSSRHYPSDDGYSLYRINSTIWQYRRSGHSSWSTASGTNRTISLSSPSVDLTKYGYSFRFAYNTEGGTTAFSPISSLSKKAPATTSPSNPSSPSPSPSNPSIGSITSYQQVSGNIVTLRRVWLQSWTSSQIKSLLKTQIYVNDQLTTYNGAVTSKTTIIDRGSPNYYGNYQRLRVRVQYSNGTWSSWASTSTYV